MPRGNLGDQGSRDDPLPWVAQVLANLLDGHTGGIIWPFSDAWLIRTG